MSYRSECKYGDSCGFDFCVPEYCKDFEPAQMTNADRIRAMDDEELAGFLILSPEIEFDVCCLCRYGNQTPTDDRGQCLALYACDSNARAKAFKKWLQQPCKDSPAVERG